MRIGDRLIQAGLINEDQLMEALAKQKEMKKRKKIVRLLVDLGMIDESKLLGFFVEQCKAGNLSLESIIEDFPASERDILKNIASLMDMEFVDLDKAQVDSKVVEYVPFALIRKFFAFPYHEDEKFVYVVLTDPFNFELKDSFQKAIRKKPLKFALSRKEKFVKFFEKIKLNESIKGLVADVKREIRTGVANADANQESAITRLIEEIFSYAIQTKSSDVHIEGNAENTVVRCRVDGMLQESFSFDKEMFAPLASRMKLLANMDIAEKRKPQDGRFSYNFFEREFDFRVSTLPIVSGESIVARILDKSKVLVKLEDLGISETNYKRFTKSINSPYGIVFVTGPTGSGKTTTLYAALNAIKNTSQKIITVEDPVEYRMNMIHQVMVNEKAGLNFASALRSILRQDPDIIMVGEIRDNETLKIAIQAALTGHLVFSTLHTNDAISGVTRLLDMGIESFFVGSSISGIEAQRLVRKLCEHCRYESDPPPEVLEEIENFIPEDYTFFRSHGCDKCNNLGYTGREIISEVLVGNEGIKKLITSNATKDEILQEARKDGFVTMFEDGIQKALTGLTSLEEVYRVAKLPT